jgi:hypothetical protein
LRQFPLSNATKIRSKIAKDFYCARELRTDLKIVYTRLWLKIVEKSTLRPILTPFGNLRLGRPRALFTNQREANYKGEIIMSLAGAAHEELDTYNKIIYICIMPTTDKIMSE